MSLHGILRRTPAFFVSAVLAVAVSPGASPAGIVNIDVFNNDFGMFAPPNGGTHVDPTITVGDTVRWNFVQGFHNTQSVVGSAESWTSPIISAPPGGTFDHTFTRVGTFNYFCIVHGSDNVDGTASGMIGHVTVVVPEPSLILGISAIATAFGGCCVRRLRGQRDGSHGPAA